MNEEYKLGRMDVGDLIAFVDADATNASYLVLENEIVYDSKTYKIFKVIRNHGHFEVLCKSTV